MLLDAHGAGALTHDGDLFRIAAESGDILPNPPDRTELVIKTVVAAGAGLLLQLGQAGEAQRPQAIVEGHGDDAAFRPDRLIEVFFVAAAAGEAAAVDVDQNGQVVAGLGAVRGEDIQEQAGFCDYTAFFRAFKQEYGLPPSEYRKIHG